MVLSGKPKTAAEWMARLRSERATPEDHDAYERWLEARPENRASAASLDQIWQSVGALEDDPMVQAVLAAPPRRRRGGGRMLWAARLAAGVLLSVSLAAATWLIWQFSDASASDSYETANGEQRVVDLADGSRLHLNVATRLDLTLREHVRDVRLVHGQAFFEVAPNPERPFVVTAGDKEITVLGTKFDVLLQGEDTRVTVIEGRVAVTSLSSIGADALPTSVPPLSPGEAEPVLEDGAHRLELVMGDAISWSRSAAPSPLDSTAATAAVEAWRTGRVVFDSTPLRQAVAELDRYTPVKVRLASAEIGSKTVSGVFHLDRLAEVDSLVFALENSLPIVVERRGDELLLLPSG